MNTIPKLDVIVRRHEDDSESVLKLLAFAELTIGGAFVIKNIRIFNGGNGRFVVFPAEKGRGDASKQWYDIAHPCTPEAREAATGAILAAYADTEAPE